jgi:hypothetical protein
MTRLNYITLGLAIVLAGGPVRGDGKKSPPRTAAATSAVVLPAAATTVNSFTVSPATVSFTAADPDAGAAAGSPAATVDISISDGAASKRWNLYVQADSPAFTGCTSIPASAVTVTCNSVTLANAGGSPGNGSCAAAFALSTTATLVAGGKEGTKTDAFSISISFSLADSWQYIPNLCPLTLTYTADIP